MSIAERIDSKFPKEITDVKTKNTADMLTSELQIGNLCSMLGTLNPDAKISLASQMIRSDPTLPGFCIIADGELIGVATRNQMNAKLSSQYGYSLYCNKGIDLIMCKDFLCVDFFTPIDIVVKIAMQREPDKIYDFITVTKNGKYGGIVTVKDLLEKSIQVEVASVKHKHPGNLLTAGPKMEKQADTAKMAADQFCGLDFDIDNFAAYNAVYGSEKGDLVMQRLSQILSRNLPKESFSGQEDEGGFIAIAQPADSEKICGLIMEEFEKMAPDFYSTSDLNRGYILSKNHNGIEEIFPFMSITIAGISNTNFAGISEVAEKACKIKSICV